MTCGPWYVQTLASITHTKLQVRPLHFWQIGNRFLVGVGVGIAACVAPVYIQELSPTKLRGRMVVINVVMITFGQVIAYALDQAFYNVPHGWRWMVGLGAVPAGVQLGFLFFLPESRKCGPSDVCICNWVTHPLPKLGFWFAEKDWRTLDRSSEEYTHTRLLSR
jgi:MFS family permease